MTEKKERTIWGDETDLTGWTDEEKAEWLAARDATFEAENPYDPFNDGEEW